MLVMLRGFYLNDFPLRHTEANFLRWGQSVAEAPYLGVRRFLARPAPAVQEPLSKAHQLMDLPSRSVLWVSTLSALIYLLPGLMLGSYSYWAIQVFCALLSVWVAFLAGLWAIRLLRSLGYEARHESLGIWLATMLIVAFNPLFITASTQPSPDLFALAFLLTALAFAGAKSDASSWFGPQKVVIGAHLVLAAYASPFWPLLFILCWGLGDIARNGRLRKTWEFWVPVSVTFLPLLFVLGTDLLPTFQSPDLLKIAGVFMGGSTLLLGGLRFDKIKAFLPWWAGLGTLTLTALCLQLPLSTGGIFLVLTVPLGMASLWSSQTGKKYVGTLAILGSVLFGLFPLHIAESVRPELALAHQQARHTDALAHWLKARPLHQVTFFFDTPEDSAPLLSRLPVTAHMPYTARWVEALEQQKVPAFKATHYPHTPILSEKWLVTSKQYKKHLEKIEPFFGLQLLYSNDAWEVLSLGKPAAQ